MHPDSPKKLPGSLLLLYAGFSLVWLAVNTIIIALFRLPDSDSIMYGLPLAFAHGPFDLHSPMIGDFPPYSTAWGHHWPGSMWIRSLIFAVIPFERWADMVVLLSFVWISATLVGWMVLRTTRSTIAAGAAVLACLSDRLIFTGVQLHRFEAFTVVCLVAAFAYVWRMDAKTPMIWQVAGCAAIFFVPTAHPFAVPFGGLIVCLALAKSFLWKESTRGQALFFAFFGALGVLAFLAWYGFQPAAKEQFVINAQIQAGFSETRKSFLIHLHHYRLGWGYALWTLAFAGVGFGFWRGKAAGFSRTLIWGLLITIPVVPLLYVATGSPNYSYLAVATPFAVLGASLLGGSLAVSPRMGIRIAGFALLAVTCLPAALIHPYRVREYARAGFPNLEKEMENLLARVPEGNRVYFPPPMWDAARKDKRHECLMWTFAIASPRDTRLRYERAAFADAKPGDRLFVDRLATANYDPWGILPTYELFPPDPRFWALVSEHKRLFPGDAPFGYDLLEYQFKGNKWDPAESPRSMPDRRKKKE